MKRRCGRDHATAAIGIAMNLEDIYAGAVLEQPRRNP